MRIVGDLIDNIFSSMRLVIVLIFGVVFLIGMFMTVGATVVAPDVADKVADKAIEASVQRTREYEMGQEGWGFSDQRASKPASGSGSTYEDGDSIGGWGDE